MLDEEGEAELVRASYRADPAYAPAQIRMVQLLSARLPMAERRRALGEAPGVSASDLACLRVVASAVPGREAQEIAALHAIEHRLGPSACTTVMIPILTPANRIQPRRRFDSVWAAATTVGRASGRVWTSYYGALLGRGDSAAAEAVARRGLKHVRSWASRVQLARGIAMLQRARGDAAGSRSTLASLEEAVIRDGRPGAWFAYLGSEKRDTAAVRIAAARHAPVHVTRLYLRMGHDRLDGGDTDGAIRVLRRAEAIADSLGWEPLRAEAHVFLGRAYMKAGRWADALATLHATLGFIDPENTYYLASVYHNLAHTYQGEGRMTKAVAAVNRFASLAATMPNSAIHMISLRDAGVIRWEAGLHASARVAFDAMVAVIDARHENYFYAGEYYERFGDLERALRYYRAVPRSDQEEGARALSGMVRVYEVLGMSDSAASAARAHDSEVQTPGEVPLLPLVLARHGRVAEAIALARTWARTQKRRGNVEGAARAELELSGLLLQGRHSGLALVAAETADSLARSANLVEEHIRALTLEGSSQLHAGLLAAARTSTARAVAASRKHGDSEDRLEAYLERGDALAASGRTGGALAAYAAAARVVEGVTDRFAEDLDRARFHAHEGAPFERASSLLLREPPSTRRTEALLLWSQRRNAAAFHGGDRGPLSLAEIQSRLAPDRALVDYLLLDSVSGAVVVTRSRAFVARLPTTRAQVAHLVEVLRRPFATTYMGRVDLSRAGVNRNAALRLSQVLVRPIASLLAGHSRLTIVPDGSLYLLPFDLLPLDDSTRMVDRFAVTLLPSTRLLPLRSRPHVISADAPLLLVAGNAPGVRREVDAVYKLWPKHHADVIGDTAATETLVRAALPHYAVLHFATHAVVDPNDPLASYLLLRKDRSADGMLQVGQIEKIRSHAALVVLSACETENGRMFAGVGPIGLARAFLIGGARAVVATQWPVGAVTADFMRAFYGGLVAGEPPDEALRAAKLRMRTHPGTRNPFDWAGFTLVGESDFRFRPSAGS